MRRAGEASFRLGEKGVHGLETIDELGCLLFAEAWLDHLAQDSGSAEVEVFAQAAADLVGPRAMDDHLETGHLDLRFVARVSILLFRNVRHSQIIKPDLSYY